MDDCCSRKGETRSLPAQGVTPSGAIIAVLFLRSATRVLRSAWLVWQGSGGMMALN